MQKRTGRRCMAAFAVTLLVLTANGAAAQQAVPPEVEWPSLTAPALPSSALLAAEASADQDSRETRAVAGLASLMVPGGGQFYRGERLKGALMLTSFAAAVTYAFVAGIGDDELCTSLNGSGFCTTVPHQMNNRFFIGLGAAAGIQAWSVVDALSPRSR